MRGALALLAAAAAAQAAMGGLVFTLADPSGLSAEVEFTLSSPTTLVVHARNTSTGVPLGFSNADQLLTGISWDFGAPGVQPGDPAIAAGTVAIGAAGSSLDFDTGSYGPGTNVSGEFGFSNLDSTGLLPNFITAESSLSTAFGGPNLDGPTSIDGPQAGLVADPVIVPLGGLGAIQNEIIATLTLDQPISDLDFLAQNQVRVEFGSDAKFITSPEPGGLALLACGLLALRRRR